MMAPEMEKPRITEIKVRMDCNGCVQKIKKALNGVPGISDIYIDFPKQNITIVGWADPKQIVRAIKKTRKTAIICLHTEPPPSPEQQTPEERAPQPENTNQPQNKPTQTEPSPPEPPKEQQQQQKKPPPPENPSPLPENPSPPPSEPEQGPKPETANNATPSHSGQPPSQPKDRKEEIHVIHHHPPDYGYRYDYGTNFQQQGYNSHWNPYHGGPQFREGPSHLPQPVYVAHNYNTYQPSPNITEYAYNHSPPRYSHYGVPENYTRYSVPESYTRYSVPDDCARYSAPEYYGRDYYYDGNSGNGNVTSMFSEENPNACSIV
ncbi:heavy metal transport/detoxification superfamily protein [Striga asiatica]|uniref:Heavy metal transport/detoxification superfamily protein n=1 Tax=Striga asiatica TaxID=4170 RepID=A0A5A7PCK0_STRAF|nr:heavy metal transport/detoxification superfamily protein [Striga asiatica]